jgi:hypothetical protein
MNLPRLSLLVFLLVPCSAWADWAQVGAAVRCDRASGAFEVLPVIETSSPDPGAVPVPPGFRRLHRGGNKVSCVLGSHTVRASIDDSPASGGQCMGAGYVDIRSLTVDGRSEALLEPNTAFNHDCLQGVLVKVAVRQTRGGLVLETCTAAGWDWGAGFSQVTCTTQDVR